MTNDFAIDILEQYRKKPTLINEIETQEEAIWLDDALDMGIKALEWQDFVLNGDACADCKHGYKQSREYPCCECVHLRQKDHYEKY